MSGWRRSRSDGRGDGLTQLSARTAYGLALAFLICAAGWWLLGHSARLQWDNDEGIYTQQAWSLLQGHRLYRDIWIDHPPGFPYALAAALQVFGRSLEAARGLTLVLGLAGVPAVAAIAKRLGGRNENSSDASANAAGLAAAVLLLASPHFYWLIRSVNPDLPAMALAVAGLAVLWRVWDRPGRASLLPLAAAGVLLGAAASIKLFIGVVAAPAAVLLVARMRRLRPIETLVEAAVVVVSAAGVCATWLLAAGPSEVWHGAVGAVGAARDVYPSRASEYATWLVEDNLLGENLGLTALAALGLMWLARSRRWEAAAMTAWLCATFAALTLQRPMWPRHHWSLVLWPLAILGGTAVGAVIAWLLSDRSLSGPAARRLGIVVAAAAVAVWVLALPAQVARVTELTNPPQFSAVAYGADWIGANVAADRKVISDNGLISFLSGRPMPPEAVPMSSKRLAIGDLTGEELVRAAERDQVAAVLLWNNQLEDLGPFMEYLPTRFLRVETVGDDREIWSRFEESALTTTTGARFSGGPDLLGAVVETSGGAPAGLRTLSAQAGATSNRPRVQVRAGDAMTVTLVWRTTGPAPADLAAFLHGSGGTGDLQADASVGDEPPGAWPRGRLVTSRHRLAIPADHPVGPIDLKAGLYSRADLGRLPALNAGGRRLDEDQVTLIRLDVAARD